MSTNTGIQCHGYGPRPEWMDNGALQKEKALEFKQIVSQTKWKKGKQSLLHSRRSSQDRNLHCNQALASRPNTNETPTTSAPYSTNSQLGQSYCLMSEDKSSNESPEPERTTYLERAWNAPSHTSIIPPDSVCLRNPGNFAPVTLYSKDVSPRYGPGMSAPELAAAQMSDIDWVDVAPQEILELAINGSNNSPQFDAMMWSMPQYTTSTVPAVTAPEYCMGSSNLSPLGHTPVSVDITRKSTSRATSPKTATPDHQKEDALFMHYLDDVFYTQNPFYNPADKYKRAWLFSIIKQVKPAYYATLALSERDLLISSMLQDVDIQDLTERLRAKNSYYDLAVQGLKPYLDDAQNLQVHEDLVRCVEGLTSILQVLYWEFFAGGSRNWQSLLRSASPLITPLINARLPDQTSIQSETQQTRKNSLSPEQDGATCVLLGSFISLDILACASTRSTPFLEIDHLQALNHLGITMERMMGCQNSVMSLIFEVTVLDKWKAESQATHKLSIVELAKRGLQIEQRLQRELENLSSTQLSTQPLNGPSVIHFIPSHIIATKAYTFAAIIYLHVVISGPYPELPEIAGPVSDAIALFRSTQDNPKLLLNIIWPLCVAGCMAVESQQSFFRHLAALFAQKTSGESLPPTGTFFEAMEIIEQCWHTRKSLPFDCDWASIMDQSACYVLLR
ncbi:C6 transcription factor, putative [Talaromyces stipitatus ATCC 10500]|uniref:C6 transcription factor, putative n=1 Tax=Talaromyces stipitatus (strain ATCC 10500 / CBS 375.48 / QM 6759 / NRRL 1006) TaxID=441959 RepID=B8MST7_TALSN|nr:C6 transcription factor, putative [Talaromyces stipitatus ATCC 10500]EED11980.1 C6 transcription factor, putative [Talaromyces stipitatus ATCC 10500]